MKKLSLVVLAFTVLFAGCASAPTAKKYTYNVAPAALASCDIKREREFGVYGQMYKTVARCSETIPSFGSNERDEDGLYAYKIKPSALGDCTFSVVGDKTVATCPRAISKLNS